jgi:ABC-type polysaccharide/polyol phosphate transport system ATPase subunit
VGEIKGLAEAGRTVVFVSHDLDQVQELCDRVMWMDSGRVREIGPPDVVLARYAAASG